MTARVITIWNGNTGLEWEQQRDAKIAEMVAAGKTDGSLVAESDVSATVGAYHRDFVDHAAAQEFVDWWNSTTAPSVATITVTDI